MVIAVGLCISQIEVKLKKIDTCITKDKTDIESESDVYYNCTWYIYIYIYVYMHCKM